MDIRPVGTRFPHVAWPQKFRQFQTLNDTLRYPQAVVRRFELVSRVGRGGKGGFEGFHKCLLGKFEDNWNRSLCGPSSWIFELIQAIVKRISFKYLKNYSFKLNFKEILMEYSFRIEISSSTEKIKVVQWIFQCCWRRSCWLCFCYSRTREPNVWIRESNVEKKDRKLYGYVPFWMLWRFGHTFEKQLHILNL